MNNAAFTLWLLHLACSANTISAAPGSAQASTYSTGEPTCDLYADPAPHRSTCGPAAP